ncbi:MAG: hypothetical protein CVV24_10325 [Ignavibacteriae bacterium HGW-Ignavibacteriae-3]|nr:MAG: hypothetical protein CVV24_10325 [Ignavibacteriae bacterium HGW-Ignavibacteriae-3]
MKVNEEQVRLNEMLIENNQPEDLFKVTIPKKWWYVQNSYNTQIENGPKIIKLFRGRKSGRITANFNGWDISQGDFLSNPDNNKRILTLRQRERRTFLILGAFCFLSCLVILYVSVLLSRTI